MATSAAWPRLGLDHRGYELTRSPHLTQSPAQARPRHVLIVGGSAGIGWGLAQHYLRQGCRVGIASRDPMSHEEQKGTLWPVDRLETYAMDITQREQVQHTIQAFATHGLDLLIVTAGHYVKDRHTLIDEETAQRMISTHVAGLIHVWEEAVPILRRQQHGHLVSLSCMVGLLKRHPGASLYSQTKRMIIDLSELYRQALQPHGIDVTVVIPGYVNTVRLRALHQETTSQKPGLLSVDQAVSIITHGIAQRQASVVFPRRLHLMIRFANVLPAWLLRWRA